MWKDGLYDEMIPNCLDSRQAESAMVPSHDFQFNKLEEVILSLRTYHVKVSLVIRKYMYVISYDTYITYII